MNQSSLLHAGVQSSALSAALSNVQLKVRFPLAPVFVPLLLAALTACSGGSSDTSATPAASTTQAPSAPLIQAVAVTDASVAIYFSAPLSDGGAAIDHYLGTCSSNGVNTSASAISSPVNITGLINGNSYDCSVSAVNAAGTSPSSAILVAELEAQPSANDIALRTLINNLHLSGDPSRGRVLPQISDALPQLGKQLFFSKSLGGGFDAGCVSCHHPSLGGADQLSLSVGTRASVVNLLGQGRVHQDGLPLVPRNAPTVFNVALNDAGMFWDSRVESLGKQPGTNGAASGIRTPDSAFGVADVDAGTNLTEAQLRFPVLSVDEMKTASFETAGSNAAIRAHLAARIGNYGVGVNELPANIWLSQFQNAFQSTQTAEQLITFNNIAKAIGEYERSMVFVNNPWRAYVGGELGALTEDQKAGAILFFTPPNQGGGGCSGCHSGDNFSDGRHHLIAFPQIGPGKGDGNHDDFGRERETGNPADRYQFRTPSLLNVAMTAPYTHSGAYANLDQVLAHYSNPQGSVQNYFANGGWCQLPQFSAIANCAALYPDASANSTLALNKLDAERRNNQTAFGPINLNADQRTKVVAFLQTLTDPCVLNRDCMSPWIADPTTFGPDDNQLNGVDSSGNLL